MHVRYKKWQGKLLNYEYIEETDTVIAKIKIEDNVRMTVICKAEELKIPSIMANYGILYEDVE